MKTAGRIVVSSLAAFLLVFWVTWESIVIYGRYVEFQDSNINVVIWSFICGGFAVALLLTWGFYRWIR
jgi:hypothetical protein